MNYSDLKKAELRALCADRGIDCESDATNAELRALLEASDLSVPSVSEPVEKKEVKPISDQKQYLVSCDCPTPLAENPCECLASSDADAVAKFKRKNGIVETTHNIEVVSDPQT